MKLKTFPKHTENTSGAAENVRAWALRCRLSQFTCACMCSSASHARLDTKRKWKRLFYIYCLISYENVKCFYGNNININRTNKATTVHCELTCERACVRGCERVLNFDSKVVLCHLNYMRKWIWIFIRQLYCIRYRTFSHMTSKTFKNRFLLSFEKARMYVTHEFIRIHIHIHKQNVHSLHLKFTNWTKYNIHLMKRILISAW